MSCPSTATVYGATEDVLLGDELAELVPGAAHITDTHSGHNIMIGKSSSRPSAWWSTRREPGRPRSRGDELTDILERSTDVRC